MNGPTLIGRLSDTGSPPLCLDFTGYARHVFAPDESGWHEPARLLNLIRQGQQAVAADVILLPLLDWIGAWRAANGMERPPAPVPAKALRALCADPRLAAALNEVIEALATLKRPGTAIGLLLECPSRWLASMGGPTEDATLDEADAEDVALYLSSLLHQLGLESLAGLFVRQRLPLDGDASIAFEPLTNTARHYGLAAVLCACAAPGLPDGFDALAVSAPGEGGGLLLDEQSWNGPPSHGRLVVGTIPATAAPQVVLGALERLRGA